MTAPTRHLAILTALTALSWVPTAPGGINITADQDIDAWPEPPDFQTFAVPSTATAGEVIQSDQLKAQTFTVDSGSAGQLDKIFIVYTALGNAQTYELRLQTVVEGATAASYEGVNPNLFAATSEGALTFSTSGISATPAGGRLLTFDLTGDHELTLSPGVYAFELISTTTAAGSDFSWVRTGSANPYADGAAYARFAAGAESGTRSPIVSGGGPNADFAFAYTLVPEPGSLALLGLGGAGLLIRRRRRC